MNEGSTEANAARAPSLFADRAFWGLLLTQFLGAFNDNLFKQLVLLKCVDEARGPAAGDWQGPAMAIFSAPFVLLSGIAGGLSDRYSKPRIILLCKLAEVGIVAAGMLAFELDSLFGLLAVLGLMGVHSAFFGPAKYGVLPELFRPADLPQANGLVLMTTFLAIIFGVGTAGWVKDRWPNELWLASGSSLFVAALGVGTATLIRKLPAAQPNIRFDRSSLFIDRPTRALLAGRPQLLGALLAASAFWLIAGIVYPPTLNDVGKQQMRLSDQTTSLLSALTGMGIGVGCVIAGVVCRSRISARLISLGAWGMMASLILPAIPGGGLGGTMLGLYGTSAALLGLGLFAGFYSVPLQVYLQSQTPVESKGRVIGAMNLLNWIGIFLSSGIYYAGKRVVQATDRPYSDMFAVAAVLMLLIAWFYRPPNAELETQAPRTNDE